MDGCTKRLIAMACVVLQAYSPAVMGQSFPVMQSTFTGGEMSPLAAARIDAQRYYTSAATIENMIVIPQGPAVRRPGTRFVAATDSNNVARLIPFRYSADDAYVLEFTDNLMRVYRSHGLVVNDDNSIYTLVTPFDGNELDDLQVWQSADVCYIADGTDWPQKLVRTDHNDWDINGAAIEDGPFLTENLTATTIAASATTGDVNLVATTAIFEAGHVGGYWRLRDLKPIQTVSGTLSLVDTNSAELACQADQNFQWSLSGSLNGTVELQISYDSGSTWTAYTIASGEGSISTPVEVFDNDTGQDLSLRVRCTERTSGAVAYKLWVHAYMHVGVAQITAYVDPCNVEATVVRTLASTAATVRWSEGAWNMKRGFPRAIASYSDRLVLAGTTYQPLALWFSATGDYESFDTGAGDDADSFAYTLGRSEQDPILWVMSQRRRGLLAGTTGSIIEMEPFDNTTALTPSNPPTVTNTLALGCSKVPPLVADNIVLVLQRNGRKLREVLYSAEADALVAPDMTLFADHIAGTGGFSALAWTSQPYTIAWCVRADGQLASLTYDRNFQVVGWTRQRLGGSGIVESVASIPGVTEDELWLSVRRTVDSNTVRYVEYLAPWDYGTDQNDAYYVDCGLTYDSTPATTFSGLDHLEDANVAIFADGAPEGTETVVSGAVTVAEAASVVHVGLPFTSTLTTIRYDINAQTGVTWAKKKSLSKATISFYGTLGAKVGPDSAYLLEPSFAIPGVPISEGAPPLFTGDLQVTLPTSFETDHAVLTIVQDDPLPMTVRAIVAQIEVR